MPKPGTVNTLASYLRVPSTQVALNQKIGGASTSPSLVKAPQPFSIASAGNPTSMPALLQGPLANKVINSNIQSAGKTPLGGAVLPQVQAAPVQYNAVSTGGAPVQQQALTDPSIAANGNPNAPVAYNPTFSGLVGQLGQAGAQGSPQAQQTTQQLQQTAQGNIPIGQSAAQIAANYGQQIADVGQQGAKFEAGQLTTGTSPVAEGNAAVTAQTVAAQQQALASGESAALQGTGQQLTAQQQAASGLNQAGGLAYQGQGLAQQALQQAGALAQPQLAATGQQAFYNPLTQSQAPGGNTPFTGGQVQGDVALGQQYAQNISANNQAKAIKTNIQTYLAQNPTLNPSTFSDVNTALQFLNGKVSNPQYQTLSNYLQEYINTLAPILGVGGDTTNLKTQIANGFVNAAASGQSVSQVLDGIEQLAQAKLNAQQGGSGSTGGTTGAATGSGNSIWSF